MLKITTDEDDVGAGEDVTGGNQRDGLGGGRQDGATDHAGMNGGGGGGSGRKGCGTPYDPSLGNRDAFHDQVQRKLAESTGITLTMSLLGNLVIAGTKFYAYTVTGHSAMFTEAIHTLVDVGNQAILRIGLRQVQRSPDSRFQYGYGRAAFFFSLLSALSTFGFGAVYTFYEGVQHILHPQTEALSPMWTWGVLGTSLLVDGMVLRRAWKDASERAAGMNLTTTKWLLAFKDPFTVAVVFEDSAAVLGVGLAGLGIAMSQITGNPLWDGLASLCISSLLATVSLKLVKMNHDFILGRPLDPQISTAITRDILLKRSSIDYVPGVQSQWLGSSSFSYKAVVEFDGTYLAAQVYTQYEKELMASVARNTLKEDLGWLLPCFAEDVIRELEKEVSAIQHEVRTQYPEAIFVEIVPDSSQSSRLALEDMGLLARKAEWAQLKALLQKGDHTEQFNLGSIYLSQRHYDKALGPLSACLEQRLRIFGDEDSSNSGVVKVGEVLEKLGMVYFHLREYPKAESCAAKAVRILSKFESTHGLELAASHEILGHVERERNQALKALDRFKKALALREQQKDLPINLLIHSLELVTSMHLILPVKRNSGLDFFRRLLILREQADGKDSIVVGSVLLRMAQLLYKQGDWSASVELMQRALGIYERNTGTDSMATAAVLQSIGSVLMDMQDAAHALPYLQRALSIKESHLYPHHHDVLILQELLSSVYLKLGMPLPTHWPT